MKLLTRNDFEFEKERGFVALDGSAYYKCPGPNKILRYGKEDWKKNHDPNQLKAFSERGISLDDAIQALFAKEPLNIDPQTASLMKSLKPLLENIATMHGQEVFVYENYEKKAGNHAPVLGFIDAIADLSGDPGLPLAKGSCKPPASSCRVLIDWKSKRGRKYNPMVLGSYALQVTAYTRMFSVMYREKIDYALVALAMADGSPANLLWIDRSKMASLLQIFYQKVKTYYEQKDHVWEGKVVCL